MTNYTSRHLIAAHAVVLRLQGVGVDIEQIQGKDIIAEALADAERGVLVASASEPQGAPASAQAEAEVNWDRGNLGH